MSSAPHPLGGRSPSTVHECPCCGGQVEAPTVDAAIARCSLKPLEASILRAVWRGKGHPVRTEQIFDAMYADDPDGGPSVSSMYSDFWRTLHRLRQRISGSGISVESAGNGRGFRLTLNPTSPITDIR